MSHFALRKISFAAGLFLSASALAVADAPVGGVEVEGSVLGGMEFHVDLPAGHAAPHVFTLSEPYRVVMDIPGALLNKNLGRQALDSPPFQSVAVAGDGTRGRVVISMNGKVGYHVRNDASGVVLAFDPVDAATTVSEVNHSGIIGSPNDDASQAPLNAETGIPSPTEIKSLAKKTKPVAVVPVQPLPDANAPTASSNVSVGSTTVALPAAYPAVDATPTPNVLAPPGNIYVDKLDVQKKDDGSADIALSLSGGNGTKPSVKKVSGGVDILVPGAAAGPDVLRAYSVADTGTPARSVVASQQSGGVDIIVATASDDFDVSSYQIENRFVVTVAGKNSGSKLISKQKDTKVFAARSPYSGMSQNFKGQKISLNFQSVEVRSLLQIIADVANTNLVVSDSVTGQMAIRMNDVPWDQALNVVLQTKGLGLRKQGNILYIAPIVELAERDKAELEARQQNVQLAPLQTELLTVNFAPANEIAALVRGGASTTGGAAPAGSSSGQSGSAALSARGRITTDARTNTLLVTDTAENLEVIHNLVKSLDVPVKQVLIASRIVVANSNFDHELGTQFGVSFVGNLSSKSLVSTSGTNTFTNSILGGGNGATSTTPSDRYNVNLPVASPAGSLALAILSKNVLVDLELSALQSESKGQVISSPRIITTNGKAASISEGTEIPYQEGSSSGATTISFKDAVLSLNVTPNITPDNHIIMELAINKDSVGQNVPTGSGGTVPSIDTRKLQTQVLLENGQTLVLGGIYEQTVNDATTKVPGLGDIPYLGSLFRYVQHQVMKDELLVFITPQVLLQGGKEINTEDFNKP